MNDRYVLIGTEPSGWVETIIQGIRRWVEDLLTFRFTSTAEFGWAVTAIIAALVIGLLHWATS